MVLVQWSLMGMKLLVNQLTFNGSNLYMHYGLNSDNSTDYTTLVAATVNGTSAISKDATTVGYWIDIDPTNDTYTIHSNGVINNGTSISSSEIGQIGGGNSSWKAFIDLGGSTEDAFLSTVTNDSVNTNVGEIGIGDQDFDFGDGYRIDFVNGVTATKDTFSVAGGHNLTKTFQQIVSTVNPGNNPDGPNGKANLTVAAIIADDELEPFYGDLNDELLHLDISNIRVYDDAGVIVVAGSQGLSYVDNGDTVTIIGLEDGWTFEIHSTTEFNAVQIDAAVGTADFKLGVFSYGETTFGSPVELSYDIIGTDGDGDTVASDIDVTLYPATPTWSGTTGDDVRDGDSGDNILLGDGGNDTFDGLAGNDILSGGIGDDILVGGIGDDILIGGAGNDDLTGGTGNDTFVFTKEALTDTSADTITTGDFTTGDTLDISDVLEGLNVSATEAAVREYLKVETVGGNTTISVDVDGTGAGTNTVDIVTLEGVTIDLDALISGGQIDY